jgi:hypothetical protein
MDREVLKKTFQTNLRKTYIEMNKKQNKTLLKKEIFEEKFFNKLEKKVIQKFFE